jgi:hypothetical protein
MPLLAAFARNFHMDFVRENSPDNCKNSNFAMMGHRLDTLHAVFATVHSGVCREYSRKSRFSSEDSLEMLDHDGTMARTSATLARP